VKVSRAEPLGLSFAQERLWFVERFAEPGSIAEVLGFDLEGAIDAGRIEAIFAALYERHEGLRLRVETSDGAPVQVFGAGGDLPFGFSDLRDLDAAAQEGVFAQLRARPVDPSEGAFRVDLLRTGDARHTLVLSLHHMVYDGVSLGVLLSEFSALWANGCRVEALPALELHYADFAQWQREALDGGDLAAGLERFVEVLGDPPGELVLPADRARPQYPSHAGGVLDIGFDADLAAGLRALGQAHGASLFMVLEAGLAALLSREARVDDLIIGTVAAGRTHASLEGAVGPFFNMIGLRHRIDPGASFADVLAAGRDQALRAFEDQAVPFEAVLERVITTRDARLAVSPLFQVLFQLHTEAGALMAPLRAAGLAAEARDWGKSQAMQDLTFDLFESAAGIHGRVTERLLVLEDFGVGSGGSDTVGSGSFLVDLIGCQDVGSLALWSGSEWLSYGDLEGC